MLRKYLFAFVALGTWTACSPQGLFVTKEDKQRYEVVLAEGSLAYDKGDLTKASQKTREALLLSPGDEKAVELLSFIELSKIKLAPIDIIRKITKKKTSSGSTSNAASSLGDLSAILDVSASDLALLSDLDQRPDNSFFKDYDVSIPQIPGDLSNPDSPRYKISTLKGLNTIIARLCPYISDAVLANSTDPRHECEPVANIKRNSPTTHTLFALAHLIEALIFQTALFPKSSGGSGSSLEASNLFKRAEALKKTNLSASEISEFADAVVILKSNVDDVLNVTSPDSMLYAIILDLQTAVAAFTAIPGMPEEVTKEAKKALKSIEDAVAKANQSSSPGVDDKTKAFRDQLNKELGTTVKASIETFIKNNPVSPADKEKACNAYKQIVGQGLEGAVTIPTGCPS